MSVILYLWGKEGSVFIRDLELHDPKGRENFVAQLGDLTPDARPSDILARAAEEFRKQGR